MKSPKEKQVKNLKSFPLSENMHATFLFRTFFSQINYFMQNEIKHMLMKSSQSSRLDQFFFSVLINE